MEQLVNLSLNMVSKIELVYKSKVKLCERHLVKSSIKSAYFYLLISFQSKC